MVSHRCPLVVDVIATFRLQRDGGRDLPTPSSSTCTTTLASLSETRMRAFVARACFAMFVSASEMR
jgi:hypothetical protein